MVKFRFLFVLILAFPTLAVVSASGFAQSSEEAVPRPSGPRSYQMVLFRLGPAWDTEEAVRQQPSVRDHAALMRKLTLEGKLVFAGPFMKDGKISSAFYVLDVPSAEEARRIAESDPAVTGKLMEIEEVRTFLMFATSWKPAIAQAKP
jgi:uncharacterized protein YciI